MTSKILKGVNDYYSRKIMEYGVTPRGVDWNSLESQYLRFEQLVQVIKPSMPFSILDYGCGYGELFVYLREHYRDITFSYTGFDISETMLTHARELHRNQDNAIFTNTLPARPFDFTVASGIFNVRLDLANDQEWKDYVIATINSINSLSVKGFSFNALTSYSDKDQMRNDLFYTDPLWLFDYCKTTISPNVALLHDYNLYEFTIIVRK